MLSAQMKRRIVSGILLFAFNYIARAVVSKLYPVKPTKKSS
jgi:hypothetical protein